MVNRHRESTEICEDSLLKLASEIHGSPSSMLVSDWSGSATGLDVHELAPHWLEVILSSSNSSQCLRKASRHSYVHVRRNSLLMVSPSYQVLHTAFPCPTRLRRTCTSGRIAKRHPTQGPRAVLVGPTQPYMSTLLSLLLSNLVIIFLRPGH